MVPRRSQAHQHNHKGDPRGGGGPKKVTRRFKEGQRHISTIIKVSQGGGVGRTSAQKKRTLGSTPNDPFGDPKSPISFKEIHILDKTRA